MLHMPWPLLVVQLWGASCRWLQPSAPCLWPSNMCVYSWLGDAGHMQALPVKHTEDIVASSVYEVCGWCAGEVQGCKAVCACGQAGRRQH